MGCCSCEYLKESNKKNGKVNGCVYFCAKTKKYVNGSSDACENYKLDRLRKTHIRDEIYKNGKKFYNDETPVSLYLFIVIVLVVVGLIAGLFTFDISSIIS